MGRRKKGRLVSGWVVLDKPAGLGSTSAVGRIRRLFDAKKAGHAGTLDPLATGLLPIALGDATKTVPYISDGEKTYRFGVRWGFSTTTDDSEGEKLEQSPLRPDSSSIQELLPKFIGDIDQVPPYFSAIKIDGERAYSLARSGDLVDIPSRQVHVSDFKLVSLDSADTATFEVVCGSGTYVRSLARDLGRLLGCYGHVISLRRTFVEPFEEDDSVSLDTLISLDGDLQQLDSYLVSCRDALSFFDQIDISGDFARRIRLGNSVLLRDLDDLSNLSDGRDVCVIHDGLLVSIGYIDGIEFRPRRVFGVL